MIARILVAALVGGLLASAAAPSLAATADEPLVVAQAQGTRDGELELIPGYYEIRPNDHMGNVLARLRTPPGQTYSSVTFPEGFTVDRMAARLDSSVERMTGVDFLAAASDQQVVAAVYGSSAALGIQRPGKPVAGQEVIPVTAKQGILTQVAVEPIAVTSATKSIADEVPFGPEVVAGSIGIERVEAGSAR